jgi:DNA-binding CsgD family transcriptional regulator
MIEFFWTPANSRLMVHDLVTDVISAFDDQKHLGLAKQIDTSIKDRYPEAYSSLKDIYGYQDCYTYARAYRFLKCNFSVNDNQPDVDEDLNFELELVPCPMRGECKDGICNPQLTTKVSNREKEIIRLHVEGLSQAQIGERLYISERTVHNHFTNIYRKTDLTGKTCPDHLLINYAYKNHLV